MTGDDVHRDDMDGTFEFDDAEAEALLAGRGAGIDRGLSELVGEIRTHFSTATPAIGLQLSAFFREEPPRYVGSRRRFVAKVAAAVAACMAATSGLAVAGALPGPMQDAVSRAAGGIGVHVPDGHGGSSGQPRVLVGLSETTTTDLNATTTTDVGGSPTTRRDTHGAAVSAIAHDKTSTSCAHGAAVASVASGKAKTPACVKSPTTTTTTTTSDLAPVTTTTRPGNHGHGPPVTHGKSKSDAVPRTGPPSSTGTGG
jgi:hypothetical protein